jgi:predicted permease
VHALFRQKHNSFRSLPTSVTHWCLCSPCLLPALICYILALTCYVLAGRSKTHVTLVSTYCYAVALTFLSGMYNGEKEKTKYT